MNFPISKANQFENLSKMFYGCRELETLDLSNFNTINVERMDYMFYNCNSLNNLNIYNFKTDYVSDMKYMFYSCSKLKKLDIPYFNTEECSNKNLIGMFEGCYNLSISINVTQCRNLINSLPEYINYNNIESFTN